MTPSRVFLAGVFSSIVVTGAAGQAVTAAARPNVVIVLTDDQGYGDLSCHGNPILKTPEMDRLYHQSVRLTDFHVSPMCTPTRSQLMSGRDALDNGAMNVSSGRTMLRRGIPTMADIFAGSGYRTGLFGKWHLGDVYPYRPQDRGFQKAIWYPSSHISSAPDYWNNDYFDPHFRLEDGSVKQFKGYCTDILFDEAMGWMRDRAKAGEPFFAYVPLNSAHYPLYVPDKYREPYRSLDKDLASFYGMIANIDEKLGRLEKMLQESGLRDNTIVIFMSDNGGTVGVNTFNAGMKGKKISLGEGGHRVPCFIRWPAGNLGVPRDVSELTHVQDLLPTLVELCSLKSQPDAKWDGMSLVGLLRGTQTRLPDRMLVVQFSRMDHQAPVKGDAAVLWKRWRLLNGKELYELSADPGQGHNVAEAHPEIVARMREHYEKWWDDIEPTVNMFSDITIGSDAERVTLLSAADWQDVFLDQQRQVRRGERRSGPWGLDVARDGEYVFELRRWPREANTLLSAGLPPFKQVDGTLPEGAPLPLTRAKLRVGTFEQTREVKKDDTFVSFVVPLRKGPVQAQTWFYDADGKEVCGAYYTYVERK
jgi:arylsulfatase A-like enzyme